MIMDGSIVDKNSGVVLKNSELVIYTNNQVVGDPILLPDGIYSGLNVEFDPNTNYLFTSPGYKPFYINSINLLENGIDNYNVFLTKELTTSKNIVLPAAGLLALLLLAKKNKSVGKLETKDVYPYLLIGGVLVATGAIKKLLQTLGIMDSAATTNLNNLSSNPSSFWSANYWKQFSSFTKSITEEKAKELYIQLLNCFSWISDDVAGAIAVFHQFETKAEISYFSDIFTQINGDDLLTWLRGSIYPNDRLSDNDVNTINQFLSKLPTN